MATEKHNIKIRQTGLAKIIAFVIICIFIGGIIFFISYGKNTTTSAPLENTVSYHGIICTRNKQASDEILTTTNPLSVTETAKIIYRNDEFDRISFTYEGQYIDESGATKAENELHAGYYNYIGSVGIGIIDYSNNYSIVGDKVVMDLSSGKKDTPASILKLYSYDLSTKVSEATSEEIIQNYTSKGFNCNKYNEEENK